MYNYKLVNSTKCRLQTIVFRVRKQWDYQWLHSLVGRASHRYREVTGSNPVEVLNIFFSAFLSNYCINCVHNCEDHSALDFIYAVLVYDLFHMHLSMGLLLSRSICMVKTMFCTESSLHSVLMLYIGTHVVSLN